MSNIKTNFL